MALMWEDYNCIDCDEIWTFEKKARHHQFPSKPKCPKCENNNTHRKWGPPIINVKRGKMGNSADGYTGTPDPLKTTKETMKKIHNTKDPQFQKKTEK